MKLTNLLLASVLVVTASCTTYPKTYTYSPTVTINGDNSSTTPLILPNPFAKTPRSKTEYNINTNHHSNQYEQPVYTNYNYPTYNREETYVFVGPEYLEAQ